MFGVLYILFNLLVPVLFVHNFIEPEQQISRAEEVTYSILILIFQVYNLKS